MAAAAVAEESVEVDTVVAVRVVIKTGVITAVVVVMIAKAVQVETVVATVA